MPKEIIVEPPRFFSTATSQFPVIDFQFSNEGIVGAKIYQFDVEVASAAIDPTPSMKYSLNIRNKALFLDITNYGWGTCVNLDLSINLESVFGKAIQNKPTFHWQGDIGDSVSIELVTIADICVSSIPEKLKRQDELQQLENDPSLTPEQHHMFWKVQQQIEENGLRSLPVTVQYQDTTGKIYRSTEQVCRHRRNLYDWAQIYLFPDGFQEVPYESGILYSLEKASCFYHVLLVPESAKHTRSFQVSHIISSNDFERFSTIIASEKSAKYKLCFRIHLDNGQVIESQLFSLNLSNPKNSIYFTCDDIEQSAQPFSIYSDNLRDFRNKGWAAPFEKKFREGRKKKKHKRG